MESCPKCRQALTQVGQFWICSTHGQLAGPKPPEAEGTAILPSSTCLPPLDALIRIFLSYGHDSNEELVRHIHADQKRRGHDAVVTATRQPLRVQ